MIFTSLTYKQISIVLPLSFISTADNFLATWSIMPERKICQSNLAYVSVGDSILKAFLKNFSIMLCSQAS